MKTLTGKDAGLAGVMNDERKKEEDDEKKKKGLLDSRKVQHTALF